MNSKFILPVDKNKFKQNMNLIYNHVFNHVKYIKFHSCGVMNNISSHYNTTIEMNKIYKNRPLFVRNILDTIEKHWKVNGSLEVRLKMNNGDEYIKHVNIVNFVKDHCRLANINGVFKLSTKLLEVLTEILPITYLPCAVIYRDLTDDELASKYIREITFNTIPVSDDHKIVKTYQPKLTNKTYGELISEMQMYILDEKIRFGHTHNFTLVVSLEHPYDHEYNHKEIDIKDMVKLDGALAKTKTIKRFMDYLTTVVNEGKNDGK